MKVSMVIPTYWGRPKNVGRLPGDAIFDHPTPLDEDGTLGRTLRSLEIFKNKDFDLHIIVVPTSREIYSEAYEKVKRIVQENTPSGIETYLFGLDDVENLKKKFPGFDEILKLQGYSDVRNMCVISPHLRGAETIIFIDDDEVFEDPEFVDRALEFIGEERSGTEIWAKAGYYLQPDGDYMLKKDFRPWMKYWNQYEAMNEAFRNYIGSPGRLKVTPFVFGGNMVLHKEVFTKIPFDPQVPRGEDIDYLINARFFGYKFFIDTKLSIKHLPPPKPHPVWLQLRVDFERFAIEREKLNRQEKIWGIFEVKPEELDPYPGVFLKDDLEEKMFRASEILSLEYLSDGRGEDSKECLENMKFAQEKSFLKGNPFENMIELQRKWGELMDLIEQSR